MATINARIDDDIKACADEVLKTLNISHTQAISALYQYIAETHRLPFQIITQVKTPADIRAEIYVELKRAHASLNLILRKIDDHENLNNEEMVIELNRVHNIHTDVWNRIPLADDIPALEALAMAMQKCTMIFMDFKHFGYGFSGCKVLPEEYSKFSTAVKEFGHFLVAFEKA
ncbi:type II toxin-antitoxin system RelB/DinJ family antitoxin [Salmonella enterica]|nr:type II toxin-antitoxin system RelB/DinJ family antitoxin [Salmonella enterica]